MEERRCWSWQEEPRRMRQASPEGRHHDTDRRRVYSAGSQEDSHKQITPRCPIKTCAVRLTGSSRHHGNTITRSYLEGARSVDKDPTQGPNRDTAANLASPTAERLVETGIDHRPHVETGIERFTGWWLHRAQPRLPAVPKSTNRDTRGDRIDLSSHRS